MRTIAVLGLLFLSAGAVAVGDVPISESERLNVWLDQRYEEELLFSPIGLTRLGRKTLYNQIDDFSEAAELAQYRWREKTVEQLRREFDYEQLSSEARISYDFWIYRFNRETRGLPYLGHEYFFTQMYGLHSDLPAFLINRHRVDSQQDMQDYIQRIRGVSTALDQQRDRAKAAAKQGIRAPRFSYEAVIDQSRMLISGAPFSDQTVKKSPLWADASKKIAALLDEGVISDQRAEALQQEVKAALISDLKPAYLRLITWLQQDVGNTAETVKGVGALPNGENYYQFLLANYTTTDLTVEAVHQLGLQEVARIGLEMETIKQQVEFEGSLQAFFQFIRHDKRFFEFNDDAGRQAYIDKTNLYLQQMHARLPGYFGILPQAPLVVRRVEPFQEEDGGSAFYRNSTPDGSRPGIYYLHLSDMSAMNTTELESTAYHEGIPGHHLQVAIALERRDLPLFRTTVWYSAYGEGWALYAEYLSREMGAFADPYSDFGRLVMEMWRAVRLVVDTGIHARGWGEQQAIDYMLSNTPTAEVMVRSEVRRYFVVPGQATSYKVGMLKLLAMRQQAQKALGEKFDIRGFHDAVLGGGSLPLPILERRINDWIVGQSLTR